jgi:hypothetical protein
MAKNLPQSSLLRKNGGPQYIFTTRWSRNNTFPPWGIFQSEAINYLSWPFRLGFQTTY